MQPTVTRTTGGGSDGVIVVGHGGVESALWAMWGTPSGEDVLENKRQVEVRRHFPSVARVRYMETIAIYEQAWGKHDDSQEVGWGRHMEERSRQLAANKPENEVVVANFCHSAHDAYYRPHRMTSCPQIQLCVYFGHTSHTELGTHHVSCQQGRHEWERLYKELRDGL
jgi:hypothetical protein